MIRVIFIWLMLFVVIFFGIGTWRKWTAKAVFEVSKCAVQAGVSATIVSLILMLIVFIF